MPKIKLETRDRSLVGWTLIPAFAKPIEIICWGNRMFRYCNYGIKNGKNDHLVYCEVDGFISIVAPVTGDEPS